MGSSEVPGSSPARALAQRAEALIRSLAGVHDARVDTGEQGQLTAIHVVPSSANAAKTVVRNVQSALFAALHLSVDQRAVFVVESLPAIEPPNVASANDVIAANGMRAHPRRLPAMGRIGLPPFTGYRPAPHIELLELERLHQDQLQCRVVIEMAGRRRTGVAEAGEERAGAVTLAARATLDALRHIEIGEWTFEGAADVIIGGLRHVVVSVRKNQAGEPLSGAAPVHESVEHAVAVAVLNAAGLSGALYQHDSERRAASPQRG